MTSTVNIKSKFGSIFKKKESGLNTKKSGPSGWSNFLTKLQELGKALQFPIAVLPFAAILNRFGGLGITYTTGAEGEITNQVGYWISFIIQKPGAVVFDNLALLFALGTAFGLSKDHRGEVTLVAAIFFFALIALTSEGGLPQMIYGKVMTFETYEMVDGNYVPTGEKLSELFYVKEFADDGKTVIGGAYVLNIGVLGGITAGCMSAFLYNKYSETKLPEALSFFSGKRFVPMMALVIAIPMAFAFAIIWPWIQLGLMKFGSAIADPTNPAVAIPGTAAYAFLNRLLLPFGLHQILNTFFWFQLPIGGESIAPITGNHGEFEWVNGDINAFAAGIEGSGLFQGGFFPVMMGGVPAIALAMIFAAKKENRKQVAGFLGGVAAVSFISGITEPIEFSFAFISPLLLIIHATLSAIFVAISTAMQIQIGFGFSAGLIDYAASFAQSWGFANSGGSMNISANPLWTLVLTAGAAGIWFPTFYYIIKLKDIQTPGRENDYVAPIDDTKAVKGSAKSVNASADKFEVMAEKIIAAIGEDNFKNIDNCTTRLRLILKDNKKIDDGAIKAAGTFGIKRLGDEGLQIVVGTNVPFVADHMRNKVKIKK
ncbi:PTS transporter subunit EIIC [Mesoplasma photuris]|uniref:PTS transporter subunit EIIC n=1 Tax=Mesoplasma photuris TaxID=217731 RepID=UPI0009FBF151|nr:PTS transporter subunit EIIC [Mesoplasma photuris]